MNYFSLSKIIIAAILAVLLLLFFFPPEADQPEAGSISISGRLSLGWQAIVNLPSNVFNSFTLVPIKAASIIFNKTTDFFSLFFNIKHLRDENARLYFENKKLRVDNIKLREVEIENTYLGKALGMEEALGHDLIPARIIGKDPAVSSGHIIIDKGLRDGVGEDMAVLSSSGSLLGQIKKSDSRHSQFLPVFAPNSSINVITQESRAEGILRGEYGLSLVLEFILQNEEIRVDEAVITSGIDDNFPRGILAGFIEEIHSESNQPFKQAKIKAESEINETEWVYVIKN